MNVSLEKAESFVRGVCVLHNFIIKQNWKLSSFMGKGTEPRTEDIGNVTCNLAITPSAPALIHI
jgi:hypothetical protein